MSGRVDAARQSADDGDARARQVLRHVRCYLEAVGVGLARAHHGDGPFVLGEDLTAHVQDGRRVGYLLEARGVGAVQ